MKGVHFLKKIASGYIQFSKLIWFALFCGVYSLYSFICFELTKSLFPSNIIFQYSILAAVIFSGFLFLFLLFLFMKHFSNGKHPFSPITMKILIFQLIIHVGMLILFYIFAELDDAPGLILIGCILPFAISNGLAYVYLNNQNTHTT